jgi:hypothetical protein
MDLTPAPGATDGDVGLTGYAPGWAAKGFSGYHGFAWYRIHVNAIAAGNGRLALLGPLAVDSAYQIFVNGALLGGVGDFSRSTPEAYSYHYPRLFSLPDGLVHGGPIVVAIRVWSGPWMSAAREGGGIHIAPEVGERGAIVAQYRLQWLAIFEGYAVDAVVALLFVAMAILAACLWPFDAGNRAYPWLVAALLLSAAQRGNQPFFFWLDVETIREFVVGMLIIVGPMTFGSWVMAWHAWFKIETLQWIKKVVIALTIVLMISELARYPWLFETSIPRWAALSAEYLVGSVHVAYLLLLLAIAYEGVRLRTTEGVQALPAILAIGVVLFTGMLVAAHVPGIWFPWGVGISLSEFGSLAFDVLLGYLLLRRMWSYAKVADSGPTGTRRLAEEMSGLD